jgi:hypothetical protein
MKTSIVSLALGIVLISPVAAYATERTPTDRSTGIERSIMRPIMRCATRSNPAQPTG